MRFEIRWKTGLDPALVAVVRERLTLGLARLSHRVRKIVLWRELRVDVGAGAPHWVVRVEFDDGHHLVVTTPDPGAEPDAAGHVGDRVARAVDRDLSQAGTLR
jgi:hypothetical protein